MVQINCRVSQEAYDRLVEKSKEQGESVYSFASKVLENFSPSYLMPKGSDEKPSEIPTSLKCIFTDYECILNEPSILNKFVKSFEALDVNSFMKLCDRCKTFPKSPAQTAKIVNQAKKRNDITNRCGDCGYMFFTEFEEGTECPRCRSEKIKVYK
jgi:predicted Zn-ribbon and HTH transcriptional regulator